MNMTLEQVREMMNRFLESTGNMGIRIDRAKISKWADAIDAHLYQPLPNGLGEVVGGEFDMRYDAGFEAGWHKAKERFGTHGHSEPAQPVEPIDDTLLQDIEDYLCDERMPVIDDLHPNDRYCAETHLSERGPLLDRIRAALEAALRSQGKVVSADALQGLCDEWENMKVPRSANSYELGMFDGYRGARSDLTAIIGEGAGNGKESREI